ncbi:EEF1AKNMT [Symbiodinium natans]|uniref:EEF1AKNMT protein n=1 Tax=Symbiodinium natans TaxID=878477 RepID=A0A812SLM7_9DINO|nr:EEF1AKNMT [Symbiodinium natans]
MAGPDASDELPEFGEGHYWETHYEKAAEEGENLYDWLVGWTELRWLLEPLMGFDTRRAVLHLGSGNSPLPEDMYDAGYHHQTAVDISEVVTKQMSERNQASRPEIQWRAADCRNMAEICSESFPLVVDKSTLDAFFCNDQHALAIAEFIKEAFRVTSVGGAFISVSMHRPPAVLPWLQHHAFRWTVQAVPIDKPRPESSGRPGRCHCHAYICGNKRRTAASLEKHWLRLAHRVREHPDSDLSGSDFDASSDSDSQDGEAEL